MKNIACTMEYGQDPLGQEILLKDGKYQVMMEWEKPYMQACIDALRPFGDVLEIGFGCGYSATHIQKYSPKSHTIIEYHPVVAERAREWAKQFPNVTIIEDTWQNALPGLGVFDAIFFDDYPLESEAQMKSYEKEQHQCQGLLQKGNQVIQEVDQKLPFLKELVYTDADLDELISSLRQKEVVAEHVVRFLSELESRQQITAAQRSGLLKRLEAMGMIAKLEPLEPVLPQEEFQFRGPNERVLTFLEMVLNKHMRKGSRFSCFLSSAVSKYEDQKFVDAIICNPSLDYTEHRIDIDVPPHCNYYAEKEALVITITKQTTLI